MGDGIRQQPVIDSLGDRTSSHGGDLRRVGCWDSVVRNFDNLQIRCERRSILGDEVGENPDRGGGVLGAAVFLIRLEIYVQVDAGLITFVFLESAGDNRARETWLVEFETERPGVGERGRGCRRDLL